MKNTLVKRIPRELKKNFPKYFGMIVILVCTISIGSSFQSTLKAAVAYLDGIVEGNLQEDGYFETFSKLSDEAVEHFENEGIGISKNFYAVEKEFENSTTVFMFGNRTTIDIPTIFEGKLPSAENEIALDHVFARGRGFNIGDSITLLGRNYTITGTVALPDYSSLFLNNTDLVMNTGHFCVAVLDDSGFSAIEDKYITNRYSYRYTDRSLDKSEKVALSDDMMKYLIANGYTIQSFLRADQNQSISFLPMDIGSDGPTMTVFVYLLVALIAFIFSVLTSSTIENEAVIIGTLRASGYKKSEIIMHYLQPTLIIAIVGSLLGNILGYTVMIKPFVNIYYTTYSVGPLKVEFDPSSFFLTTILPVVIMISVNLIMLCCKLRLSPLKFLRKDLKSGKQRKAIKLPDFGFLTRFRLRVIIQNRGCYIMLFVGVFLSSFLLLFGIGLEPLMNHYTDSINDSLNYDYQYILKAPIEVDGGEKLYVYEMDTWFELGKKELGVTCFGIDSDSIYFKDAYVNDGVSISSSLAGKLNLSIGDELKLTDSTNDKEYSFTVKKIFEYNAALGMFIDKNTLTDLLGAKIGSFNSVISDTKLDIDEMYIAKQITRNDVLGAAEQMLSSFGTVILFVEIFSVVVYLVMMYILTKVVIDKNSLSISYMKVFGYRPDEIRKLFLTATTIVVIISLVICIPLEIVLFKAVLVFLSSMIEGYMEYYMPVRVYLEIIAIGIVSYFAINLIHTATLNRIAMSDALKNRE